MQRYTPEQRAAMEEQARRQRQVLERMSQAEKCVRVAPYFKCMETLDVAGAVWPSPPFPPLGLRDLVLGIQSC